MRPNLVSPPRATSNKHARRMNRFPQLEGNQTSVETAGNKSRRLIRERCYVFRAEEKRVKYSGLRYRPDILRLVGQVRFGRSLADAYFEHPHKNCTKIGQVFGVWGKRLWPVGSRNCWEKKNFPTGPRSCMCELHSHGGLSGPSLVH